MAGQGEASGGSGQELQRLVRTIVVDLMSEERANREETSVTTRNRFGHIDEEINNVFHIPRGNSPQIPSVSVANTNPSIAARFNPRQNYGRSREQGQHQRTRLPQPQSRKRLRTQSSEGNEKYIKDVFLLPSPMWYTVPRREKKVLLQVNNLAVDAFRIDKRWNLDELKTEFSQLFSLALSGKNPGFEKSVGYVLEHFVTIVEIFFSSRCLFFSDKL